MNRAAIIWIVLGLVVVAILIALATNRPDDVDSAREEAGVAAEQVDRGAARAAAAAELTVLKARVEAGETYEALEDDFADVRSDLARAYENAEGAAVEEWNELSAEFDAFEASARVGTSNLLDALARLIERFSADVRVDAASE